MRRSLSPDSETHVHPAPAACRGGFFHARRLPDAGPPPLFKKDFPVGRPKGSKDKTPRLTPARKQALAKLHGKKTPLEVMLEDMHDKLKRKELSGAADRARDAAPYVHPKLAATTFTGDLTVRSHEEALKDLE
jgi:hypothetical protein